jgi:hypothetical protein
MLSQEAVDLLIRLSQDPNFHADRERALELIIQRKGTAQEKAFATYYLMKLGGLESPTAKMVINKFFSELGKNFDPARENVMDAKDEFSPYHANNWNLARKKIARLLLIGMHDNHFRTKLSSWYLATNAEVRKGMDLAQKEVSKILPPEDKKLGSLYFLPATIQGCAGALAEVAK